MSDRGVKHSPVEMRDLKWSPSEKAIARKAFDVALFRESEAVIAETKRLASRIEQPDDLWELERYLASKRKEIDATFDYRYSVLPLVLGVLTRRGGSASRSYAGSVKTSWRASAVPPRFSLLAGFARPKILCEPTKTPTLRLRSNRSRRRKAGCGTLK